MNGYILSVQSSLPFTLFTYFVLFPFFPYVCFPSFFPFLCLQSLIGEEGREAYNSLIERKAMLDIGPSPAANLLRYMDTDEFDMMNAKTLPRRLGSQLSHPGSTTTAAAATEPQPAASAAVAPPQQPPRPMTLPTRGAAQRVQRRAEKASVEQQSQQHSDENRNSLGPNESCESPSYMVHGSYKFPEPQQQDANPLPLPSREGKKQVKTSTVRHVRKYPLIIPANGVQRTLSKLTDCGDDSSSSHSRNPEQQQQSQQRQQTSRSIEVVAAVRSNSVCRRNEAREYENMPAAVGEKASHTYQNLEKLAPADAAGLTDSASLQFESILEADMSKDGVLQSPDVTDGFYNFSIQKEHYNKAKDVGFESTQISGLYVNDDELRNLDKPLASSSSSTTLDSIAVPQEMAPTAASAAAAAAAAAATAAATTAAPATDAPETSEPASSRRIGSADNELAGNALFKKVRASVNSAMNRSSVNGNETNAAAPATSPQPKPQTEAEYFAATAARLADSNSVSCEDLLEFSDKKPRGCERGVDSDEVRIMVKVLGKDVSRVYDMKITFLLIHTLLSVTEYTHTLPGSPGVY